MIKSVYLHRTMAIQRLSNNWEIMDAKKETAKKLAAQLKLVDAELAELTEKFNACTDKGKLKKMMCRADALISKKAHMQMELENINGVCG